MCNQLERLRLKISQVTDDLKSNQLVRLCRGNKQPVYTPARWYLTTKWIKPYLSCLYVVISALTSLYIVIPIYQLLDHHHSGNGVDVIMMNIALSHRSALFHGFLCILINVTPVGRMFPHSTEILRLLDFHLWDRLRSIRICLFQLTVNI